ncbi:MAG: RNA polymerase sigma factor [Deltaproteobacteria bacterium]|nr:RNA polymerase sigma factor [Deltaproteobacteria bacterium]
MILFSSQLDFHRDRLLRAAFGFLKDKSRAEEACQEALLKAFQAKDSYDDTEPFYPWMYRILKNTCLDVLRKQKRQPQELVDVDALFDDHIPSPEQAAGRKEDAAALMNAMDRVDEEYAEILNLRHFQELSYADIALCLKVKEGTVMSRLYRARKALAAILVDDDKPSTRKGVQI